MISDLLETMNNDAAMAAACVAGGLATIYYCFFATSPGFEKSKPWKMMPGRLPLIGHMHKVRGVQKITQDIEGWCDLYGRDNGTFAVDLAGPKFIVVCRQDRLNEILKHRLPGRMEREDTVIEVLNSSGGTGVFTATGNTWIQERKLVSASLNHANTQDYIAAFQHYSQKLIAKWKEQASSTSLDVEQDLTFMTADTFAKVALDKDLQLLEGSNAQFAKDMIRTMDALSDRSVSPVWYWRIPFIGQYLDGAGWSIFRVNKMVENVVEQASAAFAASADATKKRTFLSKLLEASDAAKMKIAKDRLCGNVMTMLLAGTDTTARALTVALYKLARDKALQDELRTEANAATAKDLNQLSLDQIMTTFPRVKSFLHEVHRFHNLPFLFFTNHRDVPFCGDVIPKGSKIMVMTKYISTSRHAPSDRVPAGPQGAAPHEFCAQRYLQKAQDGKVTCPNPDVQDGAFGAFGYGVRACPGRTYSESLSYLVLARVLQTFSSIELACEETDELTHKVALMPAVPVILKMTPASSSSKA